MQQADVNSSFALERFCLFGMRPSGLSIVAVTLPIFLVLVDFAHFLWRRGNPTQLKLCQITGG
jgi:hypothetical protein